MQLKALKIFCDVVARRSFSRAADDNGISQSGASQVVHQLEDRLGVQLIDRSKRPFVLTAEGQAYYDGCRKVVQEYFELEDEIRSLHDEVAGRVVVASIYSVGLHQMSRYLQDFLARHPRANVRLEYLHPQRVYDAVENDGADLGLVSYPKATRAIDVLPWHDEPMTLICAPDHRLAGSDCVPLAALHGESMIGFEPGLMIRREIDLQLQQHHVEVQVVMEFDNIETIKRAVEIGAGVSLLPEPTVRREVEAGTLVEVPLEERDFTRPLGIIYRRGRALLGTTRRFLDELLESPGLEENHKTQAPNHKQMSNCIKVQMANR